LYGAYATSSRTDDHPWAATAEERAATRVLVHEYWGTGLCLATLLPPGEVTDDNLDTFGEAEVACASPGAVARLMEMNELIDVRSVLPAISVPTLVVHAVGDNSVPFPSGEYLAQHIQGSRFLPIEFNAHLSFLGPSGFSVGPQRAFDSQPANPEVASAGAFGLFLESLRARGVGCRVVAMPSLRRQGSLRASADAPVLARAVPVP
jgi:pimeloyl-ACP methyl ester carboxylesterase